MARTAERGSIISFIVVGIVLTALVAGGIYAARHYLAPGSATQVALQDEAKNTPDETDDKSDDQKTGEPAPTNEQQSQAEKEAEAERQAQKAREEQQAQDEAESEEPAEVPVTGSDRHSPDVPVLPQTGPGEVFASGFALAVVTGSVLAYRRSRQVL